MRNNKIHMRFNPNEPTELDTIIRGSYDDFVRLERRNLLVTSSVIHISFYGKINPIEFTLSGFKFPNIDVHMLFCILLSICLYFLIAYMVYAYPGFRDSNNKWKVLKSNAMQIKGERHRLPIEWKNALSSARYGLWIFFNYVLPVVVGLSALTIGSYKICLIG